MCKTMSIVQFRLQRPDAVSCRRFRVSCRLSDVSRFRAIQVDIMLELRGAPALSPFRSRKLHTRIQGIVPDVAHVYAEFMHFVDLDDDLSDRSEERRVGKECRYRWPAERQR